MKNHYRNFSTRARWRAPFPWINIITNINNKEVSLTNELDLLANSMLISFVQTHSDVASEGSQQVTNQKSNTRTQTYYSY